MGADVRRPSFEEAPAHSQAQAQSSAAVFGDDPFDPFSGSGSGGGASSAAAQYEARVRDQQKRDNFEEYVVSSAAASRPVAHTRTADFDFLTSGAPQGQVMRHAH